MTIRFKLTMASIAVILVANSLLSLVSVEYLQRVWIDEVQTRVRLDLNGARASYDSYGARIASFLRAGSVNEELAAALVRKDRTALSKTVSALCESGTMDMLAALDPQGRVLCRAKSAGRGGDDLSKNPVVAKALRKPATVVGTILLTRQELLVEGEELANRARITLLPTPAAAATDDKVRTDGMVVAVAMPVFDPQRKLLGFLYGGNLLNRRFQLVDAIRENVFPAESLNEKQVANVTIFQGDLRIATNVIAEDGTRAVGTRMSQDVYDEVLLRGGTWRNPAFVVNEWYYTAYEPIRDPDEKIVGALYVGLLQAPFIHKRNVLTGVVLVMVLGATLASLLLVVFVTNLVLRPVSRIVAMSKRVIGGDLTARVAMRPPGEMGVLCQAIDRMADAVAQREEQLKLVTRQQIGRTEKLASIGRLAAGVAHEINNPLTGVLTFAHLMREKSNMDDQDRQDLDLIIHETTRAADIVRGLLDFARERAAIKEPLDVNEVIRRTVKLIRNQKLFEQIVILENLANSLPDVDGDMNQLQQVFLNLSLNACEAMPGGGTITITTTAEDGYVMVKLLDTGCGIKKEHFDKIFEPFFTTKPVGKGTGLGLSVSYGIIQQHGGSLELESEEGQGTTFTILFPAVGTPRPAEVLATTRPAS